MEVENGFGIKWPRHVLIIVYSTVSLDLDVEPIFGVVSSVDRQNPGAAPGFLEKQT